MKGYLIIVNGESSASLPWLDQGGSIFFKNAGPLVVFAGAISWGSDSVAAVISCPTMVADNLNSSSKAFLNIAGCGSASRNELSVIALSCGSSLDVSARFVETEAEQPDDIGEGDGICD